MNPVPARPLTSTAEANCSARAVSSTEHAPGMRVCACVRGCVCVHEGVRVCACVRCGL